MPDRAQAKGLEPHTLLALYHTTVMARAIERRLWVLERMEGEVSPPHRVDSSPPHRVDSSPPHRLGRPGEARVGSSALEGAAFEVVQVAAAAALRPGSDWVVPCDLDLALCMALGVSPLDVMLAVFARAADPASAGRQSPGAFGSRAARIVMTSASAGRHVVHAAGIAYASKVSGRDEVTLVCMAERDVFAGDWHEGVNFAGAHALPLICLVEERAGGTSSISQHADGSPSARAEGYGLAAETIDGGDFFDSLAAFRRAVERARSNGGPTLIHAQVADLTSRAPGGGLRPPEELEALAAQDPIERMRHRLISQGLLDEATDDHFQRDCASVVAAAVEGARQSPSPDGPSALDNVLLRE